MWANYETLSAFEKASVAAGSVIRKKPRYPELFQRHWKLFLYDEAHRLRGRNSQWTQEMYKLQNVDRKTRDSIFWFLTGTPEVRDAGDLFPLLKLMDRERFRGYWNFVEEWCQLSETPWERVVGPVKPGLEPAFRAMLDRYALRRLLSDIPRLAHLESLPPEIIKVALPPSVYATLRKLKKEWILEHPDLESGKAFDSAGALQNELRQMASNPPTQVNPKLDATIDLLEDNATEPVIVWCWYRKTANRWKEAIAKTRRDSWLFTGDSSSKDKAKAISEFSGSRTGVLVATVAAMKEGVNLQNCALNVFVEQSDLPSDNDQAIKRTVRRGQDRPVRVVHIQATRSEDERVHAANVRRDLNIRRSLLEELQRGIY